MTNTTEESARPHRILLFHELMSMPPRRMAGERVRLLARLRSYDVASNVAIVTNPSTPSSVAHPQLCIDTALLDVFDHRIGSVYEWIGNISVSESHSSNDARIVLNARILRNMDDLDVTLYERALQVRRMHTGEVASLLAPLQQQSATLSLSRSASKPLAPKS